MMHLSVNFSAFTDQTSVCYRFCRNILRRDNISSCINFPEFLIKIKFWYNIDQFHIGFPVRTQSSHIFPVAIILIGKKSLTFLLTVRKNMLSEIAAVLILQSDQSLLENRPAENINSHRRKIAARLLRFFLKFCYPSGFICYHDPETACLFNRNRHTCNGNVCFICLVKVQHYLIVHFINMVS